MVGHLLFPNPPTQDRLMLYFLGMRDKQSTQGSTQVRTVQTGDVPAIPELTQIHAFLVQRMHEGFSAGVRPFHLLSVRESNGGGGGGGAFLMAHPGRLLACVRVDTCHPWNCMCSTSAHHPCTSSLAKT
jgi:hypothetical protein